MPRSIYREPEVGAELNESHMPFVRARIEVCVRYHDSKAMTEDLQQDVAVRALKALRNGELRYEGRAKLDSLIRLWASQIAAGMRDKHRREPVGISEGMPEPRCPAPDLERAVRMRRLLGVIGEEFERLCRERSRWRGETNRAIFQCRVFEGQSNEHVAMALGLTPREVSRRLSVLKCDLLEHIRLPRLGPAWEAERHAEAVLGSPAFARLFVAGEYSGVAPDSGSWQFGEMGDAYLRALAVARRKVAERWLSHLLLEHGSGEEIE